MDRKKTKKIPKQSPSVVRKLVFKKITGRSPSKNPKIVRKASPDVTNSPRKVAAFKKVTGRSPSKKPKIVRKASPDVVSQALGRPPAKRVAVKRTVPKRVPGPKNPSRGKAARSKPIIQAAVTGNLSELKKLLAGATHPDEDEIIQAYLMTIRKGVGYAPVVAELLKNKYVKKHVIKYEFGSPFGKNTSPVKRVPRGAIKVSSPGMRPRGRMRTSPIVKADMPDVILEILSERTLPKSPVKVKAKPKRQIRQARTAAEIFADIETKQKEKRAAAKELKAKAVSRVKAAAKKSPVKKKTKK